MTDKADPYKGVKDKVLVACPTYQGKHYALEAYVSAYNNFTYPRRHLFMVDNTGTGLTYLEHLKKCGVDAEHIDPSREFQETFIRSWKKILAKALQLECNWIMSIEADNICPPLTIDMMLNVAGYCRALHVAHSYPWHKSQAQHGRLIGLGCNLINTSMLREIYARERWLTDCFELELFEYPKLKGYPTVELHNQVDVKHLDDEIGAERYIFAMDDIPVMGNEIVAAERKPVDYQKAALPG